MTTQLLFLSTFIAGMGFLCGKFFKGLNPFKMIFGLIILILVGQTLTIEDNMVYTSAFVIGFIYNYGNPFRWTLEFVDDLKMKWLYRRSTAQASDNLYRQKEEIEADLHRQKQQAEEQIRAQEKQASEKIRREADNLKRQQEQFRQEQANTQTHSSNGGNNFNPSRYDDACEILGCSPNSEPAVLKKAYLTLSSLYHPNKVAQLNGRRKQQAEEEMKLLNLAWQTVKKINKV